MDTYLIRKLNEKINYHYWFIGLNSKILVYNQNNWWNFIKIKSCKVLKKLFSKTISFIDEKGA